jgi:hypothetical protein
MYKQQVPVAPNNNADVLPGTTLDAFYVGGGDGTISLIDATGKACSYAGLLTGRVYEFGFKRINSTGTGATGIVGLKL